MATIKSYTDISQSRKLSEILPIESADMYWWYSGRRYYIEAIDDGDFNEESDIRAWSLSALLYVLPYCPDLSKHTDGKWYITTYPNNVHTCLMAYDNPVDACYEMIMRLNELKML